MKTNKEIEEDFRKELDLFLKEHNAELEITDDDKPYGFHSPILRITINPIYDKEGERTSPFVEFNF
jgi:hypothetical protein